MDFMALFRVCCYVLLSLLQITTLYHVDGSTFSQRRSSKRELLNCSLKCPNGYDTDIEGNPFCRCYDPCSNMFCLGSMTCVVNPRKRCKKCPRAVCKDLTRATGNSILDNNIQSDSAVNRDVTTPATADVCSLGVQESAFKCKRKRRRWYFDEKTGTCVKFKGCKGNGNNFPRKKLCKRQCIRKKKRRSRKGRKNRRRTMTNRTTGGRKHLESRAPDVVEFRVHVDQPPKLHAAFSAPGVYYTAMCPPDKPMVHCESNPCDNCRHFYVICEVNLCGKCSANYFHRRTGRQLTKCSV